MGDDRLAILGPNKVTDASRRTWYLGGSESLFEQGESDVFVPVRPFPPLYVWPSRLASSSRLASKLSRLAHQQSSPGSHKSTELNRLETYMRHLIPAPPAATNAPVPLTQLVGDLRIGRYDRKPYKQNAWKFKTINGAEVWCYGGDETNLVIHPTAKLGKMLEFRTTPTSRIIIGEGAQIGDRCIIQSGVQVVIGPGSILGAHCLVMDRNHHGIGGEPEVMESIDIGDRAEIGEYSVLLAGAKVFTDEKLGKHSVVSKAGPVRTDREQMPLLEPDVEIRIRHALAYNQPVVESDKPCIPLHSIDARGNLDGILLAPKVGFYRVPWGPPIMCCTAPHTIAMNDNSFIHNSTQLFATGGSIHLGRNLIMSWRVLLLTELEGHEPGDIFLEDQVWVSAMSVLLPGTKIGRGSLVAAGSVVQGTFPPFSIIAGHPATVKATIEPFEGPHGHHLHDRSGKSMAVTHDVIGGDFLPPKGLP